MKKILIDTDPGIDDFFALLLAIESPEVEIVGVSSVAGNVGIEDTTRNLLGIVGSFKKDIEVAKGASGPLERDQITAGHIHGSNGLGGIELPLVDKELVKEPAWDFIYHKAVQEKSLKILAIGPLTNLAISLLKYPDLEEYIDEVVIMGGAFKGGNVTPTAEFNIYADPLAAQIVLNSKIKKTMVGLDVTMEAGLSREKVTEIKGKFKNSNVSSPLLEKLYENVLEFGFSEVFLHDALAMAYLIDDKVLEVQEAYVEVELYSSLCQGQTLVDFQGITKETPNVNFATVVDKGRFEEIILERLCYKS